MNAFDKIIGYNNVKEEIYQIIDMYENLEYYESLGASIPKGLMLYGEPGMGKTILAKALIKEAKVNSYLIRKNKSKNDILNEINEVFNNASKDESAIIFIDDIDKFKDLEGDIEDNEVLNTIQAKIDDVHGKNVLVVATCNDFKHLPDSLVRDGRFDRKIELKTPSKEDAAKIIKYYMKDKQVDQNLNYDDVTKLIQYSSCASLEKILNEAAITAGFQNKEYIEINDIVETYLKENYYDFYDIHSITEEKIEETSLHEAGHTVIAEILNEGSVDFVSIKTNNSNIRGITKLDDEFFTPESDILISLGGKAACELYLNGKNADGCVKDLSSTRDTLRKELEMKGTYGMGFLGELSNNEDARVKTEIAIQVELERYFVIAKRILISNKTFLMNVYNELKSKNYLLASDIKRIREVSDIKPLTFMY